MNVNERRLLSFIELDLRRCILSYGVYPCSAALGVTGDFKCFNSPGSCQDPESFSEETMTLRFAVPTEHLPANIECIPNIGSISFTSAVLKPGISLGERATLSVTFKDHKSPDTGSDYDQYPESRDYDPFEQGTYWGKFRARHPFLRGRSIRWIQGTADQAFEDMEVRHFIIDSFTGPTMRGEFTITAKDPLKFLDSDRALAPFPSEGFLLAGISAVATAATLAPVGVGDTYATSGFLNIGGKEVVSFTRAGDNLTIVRGLFNTVAVVHNAEDRVQECLRIDGLDAAQIMEMYMVDYSAVPSSYIPIDDWLEETTTYLQTSYTALITEPTSVRKLADELVEQAALSVWWDDLGQKIRMRVLRGITAAEEFNEDYFVEDSFGVAEQPNARLSQVMTHFAKINPLQPNEQTDNYRSIALTVDIDAEVDYGSAAIKKIFSRYISVGGRSNAERLNDLLLARYRDPPRKFTFSIMRYNNQEVVLGSAYLLRASPLQDEQGAAALVPAIVTGLDPSGGMYRVVAEEALFISFDLANRQITIDGNINNINLRELHDANYPEPVFGDVVTFTIEAAVIVGSGSTALPAVDVGTWPAGVSKTLRVRGRIQGAGGKGGNVIDVTTEAGSVGGVALLTTTAIDLEIPAGGEIFGGAGGGGAALSVFGVTGGGGGGAGKEPGLGGSAMFPGASGTEEAGGLGGNASLASGGNGGNPGLAGAAGTGDGVGAGGNPGSAIDGDTLVNVTVGPGDIRGPRVN